MGNESVFHSKFLHLFILTLFPEGFERTSKRIKDQFFQINLELTALVMKHLKSYKNCFNDNTLVCTRIMDYWVQGL